MSISVFMLIIFSFCIVVSHNGFSDMETEKNEAIFEELYQKWEHRVRNDPEFALSAFSTFAENYEEFDAIVELGIPALPLIFEKIEGNRGFFGGALIVAVNKICKISPRDIFIFVDSIQPQQSIWNGGMVEDRK